MSLIQKVNWHGLLKYNSQLIRSYSVQVNRKINLSPAKLEEEWKKAKPFKSMPRLSVFEVIKSYAPGGERKSTKIAVL